MGAVILGRYELQHQLGEGGFGTVHAALDRVTGGFVAVKSLLGSLARDEELVRRFRREADVLRDLPRSPHIARLIEFGVEGGICYLVMELLDGEDLASLLRRGRLSAQDAVRVAMGVGEALRIAHQRGIVHRDIKPENIRLTASGVVKLMDFGIARPEQGTRFTSTGSLIGTPHYIAPEIWNGQKATPRSDIYALGVVMYEALAGRPPFDGPTPPSIMMQHLTTLPAPLSRVRADLPTGLESIIFKALAQRPEDRFGSAEQVLRALAQPDRPVGNIGRAPVTTPGPVPGRPPNNIYGRPNTAPSLRTARPPVPGAYLVGAGQPVRLERAVTVIGRDPTSHVLLEDTRASAMHARIELTPRGYVLRDLDSRNGTFINGDRVHGVTPLTHGDRISVGQSSVQFMMVQSGGGGAAFVGGPSSADASLGASLCHGLAIFLIVSKTGLFGLPILLTLGIWLFTRQSSPWIAYHAAQAASYQLVVAVVLLPLDMSVAIWVWLAATAYAGYGAFRCSQGQDFRYPVIGPFVAQLLGRQR